MKKIVIDTANPLPPKSKVLMIYTGGTIGMIYDKTGSHLVPFDFELIEQSIPELQRLSLEITVISTNVLIDSANVCIDVWLELAQIIKDNDGYDGYVILHGTDTMAYSASALSFFFADFYKPIIFTGAQLPIGEARNDARINLITSLEIAGAKKENGTPQIPEVCVYFDYYLWRGSRTTKVESSQFNAFFSPNYPHLAEAGINIEYRENYVRSLQNPISASLECKMSDKVGIIKMYPNIQEKWLTRMLDKNYVDAIVLETYGSGTTSTQPWLLKIFEKAISDGITILNITQCQSGSVSQGLYETSKYLNDMGIVSGYDMTAEAAITKLMYLLGNDYQNDKLRKILSKPLVGEMTL